MDGPAFTMRGKLRDPEPKVWGSVGRGGLVCWVQVGRGPSLALGVWKKTACVWTVCLLRGHFVADVGDGIICSDAYVGNSIIC